MRHQVAQGRSRKCIGSTGCRNDLRTFVCDGNFHIPTSVYAEMTPNPAVLEIRIPRGGPGDHQLEFRSKAEAMLCSPLATELFNFPFVTSVFVSGQMVSVTKDESLGWEMIVQQLLVHPRMVDGPRACRGRGQGGRRLAPVGRTLRERSSGGHGFGLDPEAVKFIAEKAVLSPQSTTMPSSSFSKSLCVPQWNRTEAPSTSKPSKTEPSTCTKGRLLRMPISTQTLKGGIEQLLKSKLEAVEEVVALGV